MNVDSEKLIKAEKDVYTAVTLALGVLYGKISATASELTEVYYILWKWSVKAPEHEMVKKLLNRYHEKFSSQKELLNEYVEMRSTIDEAIARSNSLCEVVDRLRKDFSYLWEDKEEMDEVSKIIWDLSMKKGVIS